MYLTEHRKDNDIKCGTHREHTRPNLVINKSCFTREHKLGAFKYVLERTDKYHLTKQQKQRSSYNKENRGIKQLWDRHS